MPSPSTSDVLWLFFSTLFRARYSLLTLTAPAFLAVWALWWRPRGTLYSLLVPRVYKSAHIDHAITRHDLFWIAFTAFCVATLAGAGVNVASTHGPERTPSYRFQAPGGAVLSWGWYDTATAWPGLPLAAVVCSAAILPLAAIAIWQREQPPTAARDRPQPAGTSCSRRQPDVEDSSPLALSSAIGSVAAGGIAAAGVVLLVGVLRRSLFGDDGWILPLRPPLDWDFGWSGFGTAVLARAGALFAFFGCRVGYLDHNNYLLAGQAELVLSVAVASLLYAWSLFSTAYRQRPAVRFCTAVYLLVCVGTAGVVLAGVAFWLDRFAISAPLLIAFIVALVAIGCRTDHFFQLRPRHAVAGATPCLPELKTCLMNRLAQIPKDGAGNRTAIVVTASGGGIQASAWTAEVLTRLAAEIPHFERSLCLVSGVSGGSVGAGVYLAGTYPDSGEANDCDREERRASIRNRSRASLLEYVAWGVAFADLPRLFTGLLPRNRLVDRGWAVEHLLEKRLSFSNQPSAAGRQAASKTLRDLCAEVAAGTMPVPLFNATCVQTGQRVIMSPVRFTAEPHAGSRSLHIPADYSRCLFKANPTLATAIRLSATFSYVSPVARPTRQEEQAWKFAVPCESSAESPPAAACDTPDPAAAGRFSLHLCDGGYADNSGVVAAVEAAHELLNAIKEMPGESGDRFRILFIRIESFPESNGQPAESSSGFRQIVFGPASGLMSARVNAQEERAKRELEAFSVTARFAKCDFRAVTIRFGARKSPPDPSAGAAPAYPPLSWALSHRQQHAIEAEWEYVSQSPQPVLQIIRNDDQPSLPHTLADSLSWLRSDRYA